LLESGRVRKNRHGQEEKVWVHRDKHPFPPPLVDRVQPVSKDHQIATLEAKVRGHEHTMRQALNCLRDPQGFNGEASAASLLDAALR